ncbi:hypothetical protein EON63_24255, partial [archaeon]
MLFITTCVVMLFIELCILYGGGGIVYGVLCVIREFYVVYDLCYKVYVRYVCGTFSSLTLPLPIPHTPRSTPPNSLESWPGPPPA